ncbi:MAG TPA: zf-HC2 domain-containing protein [Patescibacteria group bacterium]|nr:zf-HC2 domain-containing protein [Patescibacteria group bacterium]
MDCHLFRILLQRYHDGELDAVERAEYERHLTRCTACRELDHQFTEVFRALDGIPLMEPADDFNARVMTHVNVSRYRARRGRRAIRVIENAWWWVPRPVRIAIPVCAAFALFAVVYTPVLEFLLATGERALAFAGSSLLVIKELAGRSGAVLEFLGTAAHYRVAGEVLVRTVHRIAAEIPITYIGLAAVALVFVFYMVIRAARIAWKKGDTNAGTF